MLEISDESQPARASPPRSYRDLIAWQRAMTLARVTYTVTATFPPEERFGLVAQMRRAAVSIPSNIAEGYARESRIDYLRFLKLARGSLAELGTQWELARQLGFLKDDQRVGTVLDETGRVLHGLIKSLRRTSVRPTSP